MRMKLYLRKGDYRLNLTDLCNWILCLGGLSEYFDLSDEPKIITVSLTKKPSKNSYFIKKKLNPFNEIIVHLSNGEHETVGVYNSFLSILDNFPNGCYISVIA